MEIICSLPFSFSPLDSCWIPHSNRFISVGSFNDGKGIITIYQLDKNSLQCHSLRNIEHKNGFRSCCISKNPDSLRQLITGQYDGSVSLWDISHCSIPIWSGKHKSLVNKVSSSSLSYRPEFVSCSRDGIISIWDTRLSGSPVINILSNKQNEDCWSVKFDPNNNDCLFGGYKNGDICGYDLRQKGTFWKHSFGGDGICDIDINKDHQTLLVSSIKGKYYIFKLQELNNLKLPLITSLSSKIHSSYSTIWKASYSPFSNQFMLTTNNGSLSLYNQIKPNDDWDPIQVEENNHLRISDCGILSFDWNTDMNGLFLFSCLDKTTSIGIHT